MDVRLDGKIALVTGADSGIGQGIALCLAQSGADVVVHYYSDRAGAESTAEQVQAAGQRAMVCQADVGKGDDVARMFGELDAAFGRIDVLVSNAGTGVGGSFLEMPPEAFDRVLHTNLYGAFHCGQAAATRMVAQGGGGRIMFISSVHEEAPLLKNAAYNASKGGLRNLMRSMSAELAEHQITANGIAPGMILTPMNQRALDDPEYLATAEAQIPLLRAGKPADIAHMACFLASDLASYCTGGSYFVDGGWMMTQPSV